jgi:hypothetical protein
MADGRMRDSSMLPRNQIFLVKEIFFDPHISPSTHSTIGHRSSAIGQRSRRQLNENAYLNPQFPTMSAPAKNKTSAFLLFPWGLLSIILILALNLSLSDSWFRSNWSWITLVLIIPAAILENFKVGYSTMKIMFRKVIYSLISFLLVGMAFGAALAGWHLEQFQHIMNVDTVKLPWYVLLALVVMLLIQIAQLFSMLKAVKREFMQLDEDQ